MLEIVKKCSDELIDNLSHVNGQLKEVSFSFNTGNLVDDFVGSKKETKCDVFNVLKERFKDYPSPFVYWIKIESVFDVKEVYAAINAYKSTQVKGDLDYRAVPALKNSLVSSDAKTLYVGCCGKTNLIDRMFWHLGYYGTGRTQGLQLCKWAKTLELQLTINVITLPPVAIPLIEVYEKCLAVTLKPIVGKH